MTDAKEFARELATLIKRYIDMGCDPQEVGLVGPLTAGAFGEFQIRLIHQRRDGKRLPRARPHQPVSRQGPEVGIDQFIKGLSRFRVVDGTPQQIVEFGFVHFKSKARTRCRSALPCSSLRP